MRSSATVPAGAYPNLTALARLLGVSKSTLSQRRLDAEPFGNEKRFAPRTVLRLAAYYRRRSVATVADELIERARTMAEPGVAQTVELEVRAALAELEDRSAPANLDELSREFDRLLERMQDPDYQRRMDDAWETITPEQMGRAAVTAARRRRTAAHA